MRIPVYAICEQQRRRSDCASAQSEMRSLISVVVVRSLYSMISIDEPRHDKTNKVTVRPAKTQISLGIRPV